MTNYLEHIIQLHRAAKKCENAATTAEGIDKQYYLEAAAATMGQAMAELEAAWRRASAERDRLNEAAVQSKAERRAK